MHIASSVHRKKGSGSGLAITHGAPSGAGCRVSSAGKWG